MLFARAVARLSQRVYTVFMGTNETLQIPGTPTTLADVEELLAAANELAAKAQGMVRALRRGASDDVMEFAFAVVDAATVAALEAANLSSRAHTEASAR